MRYKIITQVSDWFNYSKEIAELLSTSTLVTPHNTTSWLMSWWNAYGSEHKLRIGLFWVEDQLVGYAPLMISHKSKFMIPYRLLHFIGEGISDYADIFSRNDDFMTKTEMVQIILSKWEWDIIILYNVREGSNTIAAVKNKVDNCFIDTKTNTRCLFITLSDLAFEEYYKSLSRNHRREIQKRKHKLDSLGTWSLNFNPRVNPEDLFKIFGYLHTSRSKLKGWVPLYEDPAFHQFFLELFNNPQSDFEILYSTLNHEENLISYTFGFIMKNIYYHWNIGFSNDYKFISPNKIHHGFLIEECIKRGYKEFDFMRGDSEYKFNWTKSLRYNYKIQVIKKSGLLGKIFYLKTLLSKITKEPRSFMPWFFKCYFRILL